MEKTEISGSIAAKIFNILKNILTPFFPNKFGGINENNIYFSNEHNIIILYMDKPAILYIFHIKDETEITNLLSEILQCIQ